MEYIQNKNIEKENKDFVIEKKKNKNKSSNNFLFLQNKIIELEKKLGFYEKYENNLSNNDLSLINNTTEIIEQLIHNLDKNFIIKGQFRSINTNLNITINKKQIEF